MANIFDKLKSALEALEPEAKNTLEKVLDSVLPGPARPIANMVIDTVDNLVRAHNPSIDNGVAAKAVAADPVAASASALAAAGLDALAARVVQLETHVAALTVATNNATSQTMIDAKAQIAQIAGSHAPPPAAE